MNRLKELRNDRGLNQRELAERAHVAQSLLSDFELGKRRPWLKAMRKLAHALGVSVGEVFPEGDKL